MTKPVILITGASQGIGAAIAKTFAREVRGCRLALVARNKKNLRSVARECE
jgi:short-subunit dehydrogenase